MWTRCAAAWYRYREKEKEKREARKEQHVQIFDQLFLECPPVPIPLLSFPLYPPFPPSLWAHSRFNPITPHPDLLCIVFPIVWWRNTSTLASQKFLPWWRILTFYSVSFTCGSCGPLFNESVHIIHSEFCSVLCAFLEGEKWIEDDPKKVCLETRIRTTVVLLATPCAVNRQCDIWSKIFMVPSSLIYKPVQEKQKGISWLRSHWPVTQFTHLFWGATSDCPGSLGTPTCDESWELFVYTYIYYIILFIFCMQADPDSIFGLKCIFIITVTLDHKTSHK